MHPATAARTLFTEHRISVAGAKGYSRKGGNAPTRARTCGENADSPVNTRESEAGGLSAGLNAFKDARLAEVVKAWDTLPEVVKAGIMAMVDAAGK
jgi:hypothetical protein